MRVNVRGGTAQHGEPSLCLSCRSATIVKGARLRDDIVECGGPQARILCSVSPLQPRRQRDAPDGPKNGRR